MSLFFGNNIALKGMMAQQTALNVAFNNVANASTDGYSRQRVDLQTSYSISGIVYGEQLGSGVDVGNIGRIRDEFIDYQLRTQTSELTGQSTVHDILNNMEIIFNESARDIGLSSDLNKFWNAWQDVAVNPSSPAVRTVLMESAVTLSDHIRGIYSQLNGVKNDIQTQIGQTITEVESLASRINTLNSQIINSSMNGETPNDLLDSRDIWLDKLAEIGNITVSKRGATGAIDIKLGEHTIVDQAGVHMDGFDPATVSKGSLAALQKLGGAGTDNPISVQYYMEKLNTMAANLAENVNKLHIQGFNLDGESGLGGTGDADGEIDTGAEGPKSNPGALFFTANKEGEAINAANLIVNSVIRNDVYKIAASNNPDNLTGNGENALALASLRTTSQIGGSGQTIDGFYQETVTQLGSKVNEAESNVINQQALVTNLSIKKESVSGVSLDEETANMVVYQHAFSACARVISIVDEMLDTIINRMKA